MQRFHFIAVVCCFCLLGIAPEPAVADVGQSVDTSAEERSSLILTTANLMLSLVNVGQLSKGSDDDAWLWLGMVLGAGTVAYAAAEDPEYAIALGISGAFSSAVGLFRLANGPAASDSGGLRAGPALLMPARGRPQVGLGLSGGF